MYKQSAFFLTGMAVSLITLAQAYEGKVKFGKLEEPAIIMVYDYPQAVVENALNAKLADKRLKGNRSKGFNVYTNAVINEISRSSLDYSFKVEEKGKRGAEKTTVYMVMQGSGDIDNAASLSDKGKHFLQDMAPYVTKSNAIMKIKKQEGILLDEEDELKSLEKNQKELEEKLEKNRQKQETQKKIIASQKAMLEDMKASQE